MKQVYDKITFKSNNSHIIIKENPQVVFYKFLEVIFSKKSSGIIHQSAIVHSEAEIGQNVQIDPFCLIGKCKIGDNTIISSHTVVEDSTEIGINSFIGPQSVIGADGIAWIWDETQTRKIQQPQLGGVSIGANCFLGANTIIVKGSLNENTTIGAHTFFAPGCRIGHGTIIEDYVHFANNITTGGNSFIGRNSFLGSSVTH